MAIPAPTNPGLAFGSPPSDLTRPPHRYFALFGPWGPSGIVEVQTGFELRNDVTQRPSTSPDPSDVPYGRPRATRASNNHDSPGETPRGVRGRAGGAPCQGAREKALFGTSVGSQNQGYFKSSFAHQIKNLLLVTPLNSSH